ATIRSVGRGTRQICRWPLLYHRPLPDGAVVKALTISRRRSRPGTGPRSWQWSVSLSVEVPAPDAPDGVACGIDLGWRKIEDGVRVATTVGEDDAIEHVVLPLAWLDARRAAAETAGRLRVAARDLVLPPQVADADREKVRDLADRLQALPKEARGTARDWLDEYKNAAGTIGRLERQRRDLYRVAAARLVRRYSMIGIDGSGLATIARDRSMPPEVRRMRTWTAPHELMQALSVAARREGVVLRQVSGSSTIVCHRCRHSNAVSVAQRLELVWRCAGCGALWDQDENAARNCLAAVLDASAAAALSPPPAKQLFRPPRLTRKGDRSKTAAQTIVATAQIE
ncbi:MAG TPA: zinc ribbon domain-containing protein, partial [Stellaceae bacterium]|nr:zinc ribbon domain-containing protein [Stellaceae bacterium]